MLHAAPQDGGFAELVLSVPDTHLLLAAEVHLELEVGCVALRVLAGALVPSAHHFLRGVAEEPESHNSAQEKGVELLHGEFEVVLELDAQSDAGSILRTTEGRGLEETLGRAKVDGEVLPLLVRQVACLCSFSVAWRLEFEPGEHDFCQFGNFEVSDRWVAGDWFLI